MATTPTTNFSIGKPAIGGSIALWPYELNDALDAIDAAIKTVEDQVDQLTENFIMNPCFRTNQILGSLTTWNNSLIYAGPYYADGWTSYNGDRISDILGATNGGYTPYTGALGETGYNDRSDYAGRFQSLSSLGPTTKIEGWDYSNLHGLSEYTLRFMVRADTTGTFCVSFRDASNTASYVVEYSITTTDWEQKTITLAPASVGTWNLTSGAGLQITFSFGTNASLQADTVGVWQSGNFIATANQGKSNDYYLTQVEVRGGSSLPPFANRHIAEEHAFCRRYFEQTMDNPISASSVTRQIFRTDGSFSSANRIIAPIRMQTRKHMPPTVTVIAYSSGTLNAIRASGLDTSATAKRVGEYYFHITNDVSGTHGSYQYHFIADALL